VKLDGTEYLIMKESDIMGVIEDKAAVKKAPDFPRSLHQPYHIRAITWPPRK